MESIERYGDIIHLRRPVHSVDRFDRRHPKMPMHKRACIFAPFAALSGHDARIRSMEIRYEDRRTLSGEERRAINAALCQLAARRRPMAEVTYFKRCADPDHDAFGRLGLYHTARGAVQWVDPVWKKLRVGDTVIPFEDIYRILLKTENPDRQGR